MPKRDQDYNLIAALHDLLGSMESYERYLKDATDCPECTRIWELLRARTDEAVSMVRQEIQNHVAD
ncbi:MAG TPA: hypothetical protein VEQ11_05275 [Chloroflexota bacterium]|nr:hypothetical protein [Chloroflexota bacterium]